MSKVAVVPSPRYPVSKWEPMLIKALGQAKITGLEEVRVLGDTVPATHSWVNTPARQNSGLIFREVRTDWQSQRAVQERNDSLLTDADLVVVLGEIMTSSAKHAVGRALAEKKSVLQVVGDEPIRGTTETLVTAPGYEIEVPRALGEAATGLAAFMAPAEVKKHPRK